ncbi:MAG: hypothetical protein HY372_00480, partial [Candidatus Andersenbacteria bacterium]|nr:hypothetical protein [Candidatus Andersenbacteria bacterium]
EELGRLKVLKVFFATPRRKIVGGEVADGTVTIGARLTIKRDKAAVGSGEITEMQRERQAIKQARQGDQIGITVTGKGKIKVGDLLEIYRESVVRKTPATT